MKHLNVMINGVSAEASARTLGPLARAVAISLFTWRRADPGEVAEGDPRHGWWGDTWPVVENDRIGSKLWLLSREKITRETVNRARDYIRQALQWLIDDGIASRIDVEVTRQGIQGITSVVQIYRPDQSAFDFRFSSVWES